MRHACCGPVPIRGSSGRGVFGRFLCWRHEKSPQRGCELLVSRTYLIVLLGYVLLEIQGVTNREEDIGLVG